MRRKELKKLFFGLVIVGGVTSAIIGDVALAEKNDSAITDAKTKKVITKEFIGRGNVADDMERLKRRLKFSSLDPVGVYAKKGDQLTVEVKGQSNLSMQIGLPEEIQNTYSLTVGTQTIIAENDGPIFIINSNKDGNSNVSVSGATGKMPYFELGNTSVDEFNNQMENYKDAEKVQLVSKKAIVSVSYEKAKKYMGNPQTLMEYFDAFLTAQDDVSGIVEGAGIHAPDKHYQHFVETNKLYMYATNEFLGFNGDAAVKRLLTTNEAWGPWHEAGHQRQLTPMLWNAVGETTVNIYSLASEKKVQGGSPRVDAYYEKMHNYLNQNKEDKNYSKLEDFVKLTLFAQLGNSFGDDFYPILHQAYRESTKMLNSELEEEREYEIIQDLIVTTSETTGFDLTPYFEKWGILDDPLTTNKIMYLNPLKKEIWENDKDVKHKLPVRMINDVQIKNDKIEIDMAGYETKPYRNEKIVLLKNDSYISELTKGRSYYSSFTDNKWATEISVSPDDNIRIELRGADGTQVLFDSTQKNNQIAKELKDLVEKSGAISEKATPEKLEELRGRIEKVTSEQKDHLMYQWQRIRDKESVPVASVELTPKEITINTVKAGALDAKVLPLNASNKELIWESSDENIVRVYDYGIIEGVTPGKATVTVKSVDSGKVATCEVTVTGENNAIYVTGVTVDPQEVTLDIGKTMTLKSKIQPENASNPRIKWTSSDEDIVSVTELGEVKGLKAGTANVTVTTEDGKKTAKSVVTVNPTEGETIKVTGVKLLPRSLSLDVDETATMKAQIQPETATNKKVTWESSDPAVVSVTEEGVVKGLKAGKATITVTTEDGQKKAESEVIVESIEDETIKVTGVKLLPRSLSLDVDETATMKVQIQPETATNKKVTWESSDSAIASVTEEGVVKGLKAGKATITVTTEDGQKKAESEVIVESIEDETIKVTGVKLLPRSLSLDVDETATMKVQIQPETATNKKVTWESSDSAIASVTQEGVVKGLKAGKATITVTTEDGQKKAESEVIVESIEDETIKVTGVKLLPRSLSLDVNETATMKVQIQPETATNKKVTWESSDSAIASVTQEGVVKGLKAGKATITVTTEDGQKKAESEVIVESIEDETIKVTGVKLLPRSLSLDVDETATMKVQIQPETATNKNVTWVSTDPAIVSVTQEGVVKGLKAGKTTITVTTEDGQKKAESEVTVDPIEDETIKVTGVTVDPQELTLNTGKTATLKAQIQPEDAENKKVKWSSSDESIVSVTQTGEVKGLKAGEATVTVTTEDGEKTATSKITVVDPVLVTGVKVLPKSMSLDKGDIVTLKAQIQPANATNKKVTWESSDPTIVSVTKEGEIEALKAGEAIITVTTEEGGKTAKSIVTVDSDVEVINVTGVTVDPKTLTLDTGKTTTLQAQVNPENATNKQVKWSSSDESIISVTQTGEVKGLKAGEATVTVTTEDGEKTATSKITVVDPIPVMGVKVLPKSISLDIEEVVTLTAQINPTNATNKKVTWESSDPTIVSVTKEGEIEALKVGEAIITVTTDDGKKTAECKVTVDP